MIQKDLEELFSSYIDFYGKSITTSVEQANSNGGGGFKRAKELL